MKHMKLYLSFISMTLLVLLGSAAHGEMKSTLNETYSDRVTITPMELLTIGPHSKAFVHQLASSICSMESFAIYKNNPNIDQILGSEEEQLSRHEVSYWRSDQLAGKNGYKVLGECSEGEFSVPLSFVINFSKMEKAMKKAIDDGKGKFVYKTKHLVLSFKMKVVPGSDASKGIRGTRLSKGKFVERLYLDSLMYDKTGLLFTAFPLELVYYLKGWTNRSASDGLNWTTLAQASSRKGAAHDMGTYFSSREPFIYQIHAGETMSLPQRKLSNGAIVGVSGASLVRLHKALPFRDLNTNTVGRYTVSRDFDEAYMCNFYAHYDSLGSNRALRNRAVDLYDKCSLYNNGRDYAGLIAESDDLAQVSQNNEELEAKAKEFAEENKEKLALLLDSIYENSTNTKAELDELKATLIDFGQTVESHKFDVMVDDVLDMLDKVNSPENKKALERAHHGLNYTIDSLGLGEVRDSVAEKVTVGVQFAVEGTEMALNAATETLEKNGWKKPASDNKKKVFKKSWDGLLLDLDSKYSKFRKAYDEGQEEARKVYEGVRKVYNTAHKEVSEFVINMGFLYDEIKFQYREKRKTKN